MEIGHKGTDDSYIAGEGVELTVHKDSVVVELGYSHAVTYQADFQ